MYAYALCNKAANSLHTVSGWTWGEGGVVSCVMGMHMSIRGSEDLTAEACPLSFLVGSLRLVSVP
jgi:hypothetical protein